MKWLGKDFPATPVAPFHRSCLLPMTASPSDHPFQPTSGWHSKRSTKMRDLIRIALVLYLGCSFFGNLLGLPVFLQKPNPGVYVLCALDCVWLAGATFLILDARVGRWIAVLGQVPQVICFAAPGYYYCMFSGFIATMGFSIIPDGNRWAWRPLSEFRSGTSVGLIFGSSQGTGYALVVNCGALLVALLAYYGLRERSRTLRSHPQVAEINAR